MDVALPFLLRSVGFLAISVFLATPGHTDEKTRVISVNYPLHYFAERIATDSFELSYLVPEEVDPAFWKPTDEDLIAFQEADIILRNGADYAKWMKVVTLPTTTMVNTSKSFSDRYLKTEGKEHRHGNGEVHSHAGTAFTTWVDMSLAAEQARAVAARFGAIVPGEKEQIQKNLEALLTDLDALDAEFKTLGKSWSHGTAIASHPVYHYFAEAYGIAMDSLEWEPEMKLGSAEKKDFEAMKKKHSPQIFVWEGQPTKENAAYIEAAGLKNVVFNPCGNRHPGGDWLAVMRENLANLQALGN